MILTPLLNINLRPTVSFWIKQSRNVRPSIKINNETFKITIDVRQFKKDEIRVKARPEYVIIEGKQERTTKRGYIMRHFVRKYKLPEGCSPENIQSKLSPEGLLTITAARKVCDATLPCETVVPVEYCGSDDVKDKSIIPVEDKEKDLSDRNKK